VARTVERTPLRRLLRGRLADRIRLHAGREVEAGTVLAVVDRLRGAGFSFWLAGGWGADAVSGQQTKRHGDLDVVIDRNAPGVPARLDAAFGALGLKRVHTGAAAAPYDGLWVYSNSAGTTVEVLLADRASVPLSGDAVRTGRIDGVDVPCRTSE
jgi:lincosamide nucleotidyltransferase A/C/D/E